MIRLRRTSETEPTPADRAELRRRADTARERVLASIVVRVPPPHASPVRNPETVVSSGCLLCGLDAIEVPGSQRIDGVAEVPALAPGHGSRPDVRIGDRTTLAVERGALRAAEVDRDRLALTLWTLTTCRPQTIGAPDSGSDVTGYLCLPCDDARDVVGGLGAQAVTAALGHDAANVEVVRLRGLTFGSQVLHARRRGAEEPEPGRTRWAHVELAPAGAGTGTGTVEDRPGAPMHLTMPVRSTEPIVTERTT